MMTTLIDVQTFKLFIKPLQIIKTKQIKTLNCNANHLHTQITHKHNTHIYTQNYCKKKTSIGNDANDTKLQNLKNIKQNN